MSSEEDFNDGPSAEQNAEGSQSSGSASEGSERALSGLVELHQKYLASLRELSQRLAVLERRQQAGLESRRLALELRAARSEPRLPLGWIATPLKQLARQVLGRAKYRKLDFQLELERSLDAYGIPITVAWAESAVQKGEVEADVAYPLLVPALVARNDVVSATALVRRLRERAGSDASKQALLARLDRELAEPTPRVHGERIVWRSDIGPRSHVLAVPSVRAGRGAWERSKALRGSCIRPARLTAITLGQPQLARVLGDCVTVMESSTTSWRQDLASYGPDLVIVDLKVVQRGSPTDEGVDLEQVAQAVEAVAAVPILWVGSESLPADGVPLDFCVPTIVTTFVDTSATARRLRQRGVDIAAHRLGALVDSRFDELPPRPPLDTLFVLDLSANGGDLLARELCTALPEWSIVAWSASASGGMLPLGDKRLASVPLPAGRRARQVVVVSGDLQNATPEQQTRLIQTLIQGAALFTHERSGDTFDPPLAQAPAVRFDSATALLAQIGDWERQHEAFARQEQLVARFAREHLTQEAARGRFVAHAGVPSIVSKARRISVLCVSNRPERARACLEAFKKQTYPHKELVFVANLDRLDDDWVERFIEETPGIILLRTDADYSLGESLNRARAVASGEVWAKFDDDDHYGQNYLRDAMLALHHSEAAVTGKGTFFCYVKDQDKLYVNPQNPENSWVSRFVHGGTLVADRRAVESIDFQPVRQGTDSLFLQHCRLQGLRIFSGDRYNFAYIRYPAPGHHTYGVSNDKYLRSCRYVSDGFDASIVDI